MDFREGGRFLTFFRSLAAVCLTAGLTALVATGGCVGAPNASRGYPLYAAADGARLPLDRVARLSASLPLGGAPGGGGTAFIKAVDGRDVSTLDSLFELAPGCHVVETERRFVLANDRMTWHGELAGGAFVVDAKPGYEYIVTVELMEGMGSTGRLAVYVVEQAPGGKRSAPMQAVSASEAAKACASR